MIKLHLGCGPRYIPGWKSFDASDYPHLTGRSITSLPYADNSVDIIYSSHTIEYFDREEVKNLLLEWKRVLKPGATLRLAVPNFKVMVELYYSGKYDLNAFLGPLYGKMKSGGKTIYHKTVYDHASLKNLLENLGFKNIRLWDWRKVDHGVVDDKSQAYLPKMDKENGTLISLNLECEK
jgi:predicted SAM-dependent methyltransferase